MVLESTEAKRRPLRSELRIIGREAVPMRSVRRQSDVSVVQHVSDELAGGMAEEETVQQTPTLPRRSRPSLKHELAILDRPAPPMRSLAVERRAEEGEQSLAERARARLLLQCRMVTPSVAIARSMVVRKPEASIRSVRAAGRAILKPELRFAGPLTAPPGPPLAPSSVLVEASVPAPVMAETSTAIDEVTATAASVAIAKPAPALGEIASSLETLPARTNDLTNTLDSADMLPDVAAPSASETEHKPGLVASNSDDVTASNLEPRTEPTASKQQPQEPAKRKSGWFSRLFGGSR